MNTENINEQVRCKIMSSIFVQEFRNPASDLEIALFNDELGLALPDDVAQIYRFSNGFVAIHDIPALYSIKSVVFVNSYLRNEDFAPSWITDAVFLGDSGGGGTATEYYGLLRGRKEIIGWHLQSEEDFSIEGDSLYYAWKRIRDNIQIPCGTRAHGNVKGEA